MRAAGSLLLDCQVLHTQGVPCCHPHVCRSEKPTSTRWPSQANACAGRPDSAPPRQPHAPSVCDSGQRGRGRAATSPVLSPAGAPRTHPNGRWRVTYPADFLGSRFVWGGRRGRTQLDTERRTGGTQHVTTRSKLQARWQRFLLGELQPGI